MKWEAFTCYQFQAIKCSIFYAKKLCRKCFHVHSIVHFDLNRLPLLRKNTQNKHKITIFPETITLRLHSKSKWVGETDYPPNPQTPLPRD